MERHSPLGPLGQLAGNGPLHCGSKVAALILGGQGHSYACGGGLETRKGKVAVLPTQKGSGQGVASGVAALSQSFQRRATGIGQAHGLGDLVKGLTGGIVNGGAQSLAATNPRHIQKLAMATRGQQKQEGIGDIGL